MNCKRKLNFDDVETYKIPATLDQKKNLFKFRSVQLGNNKKTR